MYKVIESFTDLQDNNHVYRVGDTFPRPNLEVSDKRVQELLTASNRRGIPLIVSNISTDAEDATESPVEPQKPKRARKPRVKKNAD